MVASPTCEMLASGGGCGSFIDGRGLMRNEMVFSADVSLIIRDMPGKMRA